MSNTWLQVAQEALKIPGLLLEIYGDLAKPGVKQVGKALETTLGLGNTILWPITWANERSRMYLEHNLEKYRIALADIPEEKIITVVPEIGVPIAEKMAYVSEETLSSLYINLLVKASNTETLSLAHPSFVNIINNLSPDEALMLELFKEDISLPFVTVLWSDKKSSAYSIENDIVLSEQYTKQLKFPDNIQSYANNLSSMGLMDIYRDREISDCSEYLEIEKNCTDNHPLENAPEPDRKLKFKRGVLTLNSYGMQFMKASH